jgi:hypothetical protein
MIVHRPFGHNGVFINAILTMLSVTKYEPIHWLCRFLFDSEVHSRCTTIERYACEYIYIPFVKD